MHRHHRNVCITGDMLLGTPAFVASLTALKSGSNFGSKATVKALSIILPFIWVPKSALQTCLSVSLLIGPSLLQGSQQMAVS